MRNLKSILFILILLALAYTSMNPTRPLLNAKDPSSLVLGAVLLILFIFLLVVNWAQGAGFKNRIRRDKGDKEKPDDL